MLPHKTACLEICEHYLSVQMSSGSRGQKKRCMDSAAAVCVSWLLWDSPWHEGSCTSAAHTPESPSFALGGVCGPCCYRGIRCFPPHRRWPSAQLQHTVPHSSLQKHRGLQDYGLLLSITANSCRQKQEVWRTVSGFYSMWRFVFFCSRVLCSLHSFVLKMKKRKPCFILADDSWLVLANHAVMTKANK